LLTDCYIDDAARALLDVSAPYTQVVVEEGGELQCLDDLEEARLRGLCARGGYDVEEVEAA
jgi:hypothetical protein